MVLFPYSCQGLARRVSAATRPEYRISFDKECWLIDGQEIQEDRGYQVSTQQWLNFSEGYNDNASKPSQKEDIHEKSFHSYIYRQIVSLA